MGNRTGTCVGITSILVVTQPVVFREGTLGNKCRRVGGESVIPKVGRCVLNAIGDTGVMGRVGRNGGVSSMTIGASLLPGLGFVGSTAGTGVRAC